MQLCFSGDGSYCCMDPGPGDCACCSESERSVDGSEGKPGCERADAEPSDSGCHADCCGHREPREPPETDPPENPTDADAACGCTHMPLVLSTDEQAIATRSDTASHAAEVDLVAVWLPISHVYASSVAFAPPPLRGIRRSDIPNYALAVVATTVIRC